jgi:DNA-directed RNA polymerase specialized sigma subunit
MKHNKKQSVVKEKRSKKDYAGTEASPYQEWRDKIGDYNQEHESAEPPEANPDMLTEDSTLYAQIKSLNQDEWDQWERGKKFLTKKQLKIAEMVGFEGKTLENVAAITGTTVQNISQILKTIRKVILLH